MAARFLRIARDQGFQNVIGLFGAAVALIALGAVFQDHGEIVPAIGCYALSAVIGASWLLVSALLIRDHITGGGVVTNWLPIRERIADFLTEGRQLQVQCADEKNPPPNEAADQWNDAAIKYLTENLGSDYAARFQTGAGLPMTANSISSMEHRNLWAGLYVRNARLTQFLEEISQR